MKFPVALGVGLALTALPVLAVPSPDVQDSSPALASRDLASEIWDDIKDATECAGCETVLVALKGLAALGTSTFVKVLSEICDLSGAEDSDVCNGLLASLGPILRQDVQGFSIGSQSSQLFCITFLGVCDYPAITPYTIDFPSPKPTTPRPTPSGKTPLQIAHISDTHVDLSYTVGSNANCTKPICCRPYTPEDAPGNQTLPAGPFGNHQCDAPMSLEESMFKEIASLKPDFTIFTGDVPAHDVWLVNEPEVLNDLNATYDNMHTMLGLVYPVTGNHDVAPVNGFPTESLIDKLGSSINPLWAYDALTSDWTSWIGSDAAQQADKDGSYSTIYPGGNLRIISFNSILYYIENFWLYQDPMDLDPDGQFAWLVQELQAAETAGQRAWIIAHVPSGDPDFFRNYSNYFDQIVNRYENTVAALFYGHTHYDQFEIAYSDYTKQTAENAVAMSYVAPSMTPTSGSPAFRMYSVDPDTFAVLDYTEYIANITDPDYQNGPTWTKFYSAKEAYGSLLSPPVTDPNVEMTAAFWHNVTEAFESNDPAFQQWYGRMTRDYATTACTGSCKTSEICQMRAANSAYNCQVPTPGVHFGKRDALISSTGEYQAHRDECEGTQMKSIFRGMAGDKRSFANEIDKRVAEHREIKV